MASLSLDLGDTPDISPQAINPAGTVKRPHSHYPRATSRLWLIVVLTILVGAMGWTYDAVYTASEDALLSMLLLVTGLVSAAPLFLPRDDARLMSRRRV